MIIKIFLLKKKKMVCQIFAKKIYIYTKLVIKLEIN